jgi:hypothetical protein
MGQILSILWEILSILWEICYLIGIFRNHCPPVDNNFGKFVRKFFWQLGHNPKKSGKVGQISFRPPNFFLPVRPWLHGLYYITGGLARQVKPKIWQRPLSQPRLVSAQIFYDFACFWAERRWHWPLLLFFKVTFPIYLIPRRNVWENSCLRSTLINIIFGILQDFIPKMLEIAFQRL